MKRLKAIRAERLLTQRGLAALAQVRQSTVDRVENGRTTPRPVVIDKLSAALGVEPMEVVEFHRAMSKTAGVSLPPIP